MAQGAMRTTRTAATALLAALVALTAVTAAPWLRRTLAPSAQAAAAATTAVNVATSDADDIRYSVILDAGSTGSRIHVYRFRVAPGAALPELIDERMELVHPGLSSFAGRPLDAAASLQPLIDVALDAVPAQARPCTPIALKATAGLRLLPEKDAEAILRDVERFLNATPFHLPPGAVQILDGADEGLYAWITVNLLDGRLGQPTKLPTAGIMDLGGGSTQETGGRGGPQIVFEPKAAGAPLLYAGPEVNRYRLTLGGHSYLLYLHSHLGYGLIEARKALLQRRSADDAATHPCLASTGAPSVAGGSGDAMPPSDAPAGFAGCRAAVAHALRLDTPCPAEPCSFNGVFQPPADAISDDFYIFSFFFDRAQEVQLAEAITVSHYYEAAVAACDDLDGDGPAAIAEARRRNPHLCLDLTFMFALLRDGVGLAPDRPLRLTKRIRGIETGWCLGAAVHMLDATATMTCASAASTGW